MRSVALALLLTGVVAAGLCWGTFVAGGPDSYCYAYQAERWASLVPGVTMPGGRGLQVADALAVAAPWPDAPLSFAPVGHVPSPVVGGAIAPKCPAGLSLVMAPFRIAGGRDAIFLVVPLFGALLVGATYAAGARYGARVGLTAAVLVACSPAFLYQLVQPLSDVPAAALWVAAVAAATGTARRGPLTAGIAAAAAVLVRPNLAPLGVPIGLFLFFRPERAWRDRFAAALAYAAATAVGCLAVALVHNELYGSPLSSGYGSFAGLFRAEHVGPNVSRYFSWMSEAHSPVWLIAFAAPIVLPGALSLLYAAMLLVNAACYLPYVVFEEWAYLRFLLPTIPLVLILVMAVIDAAARRVSSRAVVPVLVLVTVVLSARFIRAAADHSAFRLQAMESRFARAGAFVGRRLPANALVIAYWQSGSVRFYSGRRTLVWEALDPASLDRAIDFARARGLVPFFLLERWEEPLFRERFAGSRLAALDWPPAAEIGTDVRIYRPEDRDRYVSGLPVTTEYSR
jgi:Dolichyl-phosphate-mannose-protein mannosyltransferase